MSTSITPKTEPQELETILLPAPPSSLLSPSLSTDLKPALPLSHSSMEAASNPFFLIYFDPASEKAGKLCGELINQTQDTTLFVTSTLSEASHVVVEPPSTLGDDLLRIRARAQPPSSSSSSPYLLTLRWIENSIRLKDWQPKDSYLYAPTVDVKEEQQQQKPRIKSEGMDVDVKPQVVAKVTKEEEKPSKIEQPKTEPPTQSQEVGDVVTRDVSEAREDEREMGEVEESLEEQPEDVGSMDEESLDVANGRDGKPKRICIQWTAQEETDLASCLRDSRSVNEAAQKLVGIHSRRSYAAALSHYKENKSKFVDDTSKHTLSNKTKSKPWTKEEDRDLVRLLASAARTKTTRVQITRLFVAQHPHRSISSVEGRYSTQKERFDKALRALQEAQSSSPSSSPSLAGGSHVTRSHTPSDLDPLEGSTSQHLAKSPSSSQEEDLARLLASLDVNVDPLALDEDGRDSFDHYSELDSTDRLADECRKDYQLRKDSFFDLRVQEIRRNDSSRVGDRKGKGRGVAVSEQNDHIDQSNFEVDNLLDGLDGLEPKIRTTTIKWTTQESDDLGLCLRESSSIHAAVERLCKMHPRRTPLAAKRYYSSNKIKFADDAAKGAVVRAASSWTAADEEHLVHLLASDPPTTLKEAACLFVQQHPDRSVDSVGNWYYKHRDRVDNAVQELKNTRSSSDLNASTSSASADSSSTRSRKRLVPYSAQETTDLHRFLRESQSTKEALEKMSTQYPCRSVPSIQSFLSKNKSDFVDDVAGHSNSNSKWAVAEEEDLVRLLAASSDPLQVIFASFHNEHPTKSLNAINKYYGQNRARLQEAAESLQRPSTQPHIPSEADTGMDETVDGRKQSDQKKKRTWNGVLVPYSSQETDDLRRILRENRSAVQVAEKMSKEHPRRSANSVRLYLQQHKTEFVDKLATLTSFARWSTAEEEDLIRLLTGAIGMVQSVYEAFHQEHPSRTAASARDHHSKHRKRIDEAVQASRMESSSSSSSSSELSVVGSSSSSSSHSSNSDTASTSPSEPTSSSSSKRASDDQSQPILLKFKRPKLSSNEPSSVASGSISRSSTTPAPPSSQHLASSAPSFSLPFGLPRLGRPPLPSMATGCDDAGSGEGNGGAEEDGIGSELGDMSD